MNYKKIIKTAAVTAGVCAAVTYKIHYEVMNRKGKLLLYIDDKMTKEEVKKVRAEREKGENVLFALSRDYEEYDMYNKRGDNLKAYYLPAEKKSNVFVLCAHGYKCNHMDEFKFQIKFLHDSGYNVFMVDHCSCGKSDGKYTSFGHFEAQDLIEWIDLLKTLFGEDIQIILYGISMGSATVMLASGNDELPENVKCTVADCGYTSMKEQFEFNLKDAFVPAKPIIEATNALNKVLAKFDYKDVNPSHAVKNAKVPMLFIHGSEDDFVPTYMVCKLYNNCSTEKDLLIVDGANHAESYQVNPEVYEAKFNEFVTKYIK